MTTIKRTVTTFYSVAAGTTVDKLSECYINMNEHDLTGHGFPSIAVVDVEIEIDVDEFITSTLAALDKTETQLRAEFQSKLNELQSIRANLLSLPAPIQQTDVVDFVNATLDPAEAEDRSITNVFYVTYGFNTEQHNNFSRVFARDYASAREFISEKIGDKFAGCYTEAEFADFYIEAGSAGCYTEAEFRGQVEAYGLTEIPLTAHAVSPF